MNRPSNKPKGLYFVIIVHIAFSNILFLWLTATMLLSIGFRNTLLSRVLLIAGILIGTTVAVIDLLIITKNTTLRFSKLKKFLRLAYIIPVVSFFLGIVYLGPNSIPHLLLSVLAGTLPFLFVSIRRFSD